MGDLKRMDYNGSSWVPLYAKLTKISQGKFGYNGFIEEYCNLFSVMFSLNYKEKALKLKWSDVRINHSNCPECSGERYKEARMFEDYDQKLEGHYLVLIQCLETAGITELYLDQDLVIALRLYRDKDRWISPENFDEEVIHLKRDNLNRPCLIEIRADYIKDYLNARKCGLLIGRYHYRKKITESFPYINWENGSSEENRESLRWVGYIREIHEGGFPFGGKIALSHLSRTDVDYEEDIPVFKQPSNNNVKLEHKEIEIKGRKLVLVSGELWKTDWIEPALYSLIVRGDKVKSNTSFLISNDGTTACGEDLLGKFRWLWFSPSVVNFLLSKPHSLLMWFTRKTGRIGASLDEVVHFGLNKIGLINVFAKDIYYLSEINKKIWAAKNVYPEGGVSEELLKSQMEAMPVDTIAPEIKLTEALQYFSNVFQSKFRKSIFRTHFLEQELLKNVHRFHGTSDKGIFYLSKEIYRLVIDRIELKALREVYEKLSSKKADVKDRERKLLESILYETGNDGRILTEPLEGLNKLRQADAHLPSANLNEAFKLLRIRKTKNYIEIAENLIESVANALTEIAQKIDDFIFKNH